MKVIQINAYCNEGSTGKICSAVSKILTAKGIENYIFSAHGQVKNENEIMFPQKFPRLLYYKIQALKSRILGNNGFNSNLATRQIIKKLNDIQPDIVHLHNIHGHTVNIKILMDYFREKHIKVFYTFHDVWSFTSYCVYFTMAKCEKWKIGCNNCPQLKGNSWFFDRSVKMYKRKKSAFSGLDLTVITPSEWLAGIVRESFFGEYPVQVINNGIDLNVFHPIEGNFRNIYGLENKKVVLGVSFVWDERKGYQDCLDLAHMLPDDYCMILVGVSKEQIASLPGNVIGIERTHDQKELAEIYTMADVFINTTYEDNYPTVNLEARACGTPVITYRTGGSPESAGADAMVIEPGDTEGLLNAVIKTTEEHKTTIFDCDDLSAEAKFREYLDLYSPFL